MSTYPDDWKTIATAVKDAANWHCIRCGHVHSREGWRVLTVHHLDGDKANCQWFNLAALCQRCHLTIQGKVVMERVWAFEHSPWFVPYVAGYYAAHHGLPTDRAWVEAHAEQLILIGQGYLTKEQITG